MNLNKYTAKIVDGLFDSYLDAEGAECLIQHPDDETCFGLDKTLINSCKRCLPLFRFTMLRKSLEALA